MAARKGGKLKAVLYGVSGGAGLALLGARDLAVSQAWVQGLNIAVMVIFGLAVLVSVVSFVDYIVVFLRLYRQSDAPGGKV